ncbi:calpain-7-like [Sycon ciliatum]|uniref:calpain-7-like n=1 Tax=Sycon ciliatum TaxID=27933 RepID=UPI0031F65F5E|eukprot:scpid42842/ scgid2529/ Calpain-7; PalB homolog
MDPRGAGQLFNEALGQARYASEYDKSGQVDAAVHYYREAISTFQRAFAMDKNLRTDVNKQAYCKLAQSRLDVLAPPPPPPYSSLGQTNPQAGGAAASAQKSPLHTEAETHLLKAMGFDEKNQLQQAKTSYEAAIQKYLEGSRKTTSEEEKAKMMKRAQDCLDRAEKLSKLISESSKPVADARSKGSSTSHIPVDSGSSGLGRHSPSAPHAATGRSISPARNTGASPPATAPVDSAPRLTPQEILLLKNSSYINNHCYLPWIDQDVKSKFHFLEAYTDSDGVLALSPKQKERIARFARPVEICDDPKIIRLISHQSIKQTLVSDCSFVASLAVCAVYEFRFKKRVITSCIYPQKRDGTPIYNESGKYIIKLRLNGIPRKIEIDDRLPVDKHGRLLCSHSTQSDELWVSLMEKAYMKVMGGYDFPGSNSNNDLHALTGWIPERIGMHNKHEEFDSDKVYDRLRAGLHRGQCLITVATPPMSKANADRAGLVETHAYAILDMQHVGDKRLLQVKNPWQHLRWRGDYGVDDDKNWTPALERQFNYDRDAARKSDNGVFWISWEALQHFFDVAYVNWDPALFTRKCIFHASWSAASSGIKRDSFSYAPNPQYHLEVNSPGTDSVVWVLLSKHVTRKASFADNQDFITVHVYDGDKRIFYPDGPRVQGVKINSIHYLAKIENVPRGRSHYMLVISQYEQTNNIDYTLEVHATCSIQLKLMPTVAEMYRIHKHVADKWTAATAGGCQNNRTTFGNNPVFQLTLQGTGTANLLVELKGIKEFAVGFDISADPNSAEGKSYKLPPPATYRPGYYVQSFPNVPCPGVFRIIPTTYDAGKVGPFFLDVYCSTTFVLERLK